MSSTLPSFQARLSVQAQLNWLTPTLLIKPEKKSENMFVDEETLITDYGGHEHHKHSDRTKGFIFCFGTPVLTTQEYSI